MTQAEINGQTRPHRDGVLHIPCPCKLPPPDLSRIQDGDNGARLSLHKRVQTGKRRHPVPLVGRVIICLNALEPGTRADLVFSSGDLKVVRVGEEVSRYGFELLRAVAAGRRHGPHTVETGRTDRNQSNGLSGHKGGTGWR